MPPKGLLVRLPTGRPLGVFLVGGRDTFGESVILDGRRKRCVSIKREGCHGWKGGFRSVDDSALCWQNRHNV